jgi:hypothetical protein
MFSGLMGSFLAYFSKPNNNNKPNNDKEHMNGNPNYGRMANNETQEVQLPTEPLTRKVEVEVCADCGKYARVFICPNVPEPGKESDIVKERKGEFHCVKDRCGNCWPYEYKLNQAASEVSTKPWLTAEVSDPPTVVTCKTTPTVE